ncbi:hypothetical protein ScalyP_jg2106, partial [Parmales sp. scaly parma]
GGGGGGGDGEEEEGGGGGIGGGGAQKNVRSCVRVDGVDESSNCSEGGGGLSCGRNALDGLTIGSDHRFDMSLCDGSGEIGLGEGEGAIGEIILFKGALGDEDLEGVEDFLMRKHGVFNRRTGTKDMGKGEREDERLFREGELMLRRSLADGPQMQLDRTTGAATAIAKGVPLKYCAGNQKVSWDKRNNVTGTKIYAARIGSKNAGQSEWEDVGDGTGR